MTALPSIGGSLSRLRISSSFSRHASNVPEAMPVIVAVEQPAMAGQRVALNPPVVEEPHVGPELLAAAGFAG